MKKKRLIRTKNTILAAFGAVLLSIELVFAVFMEALLIPTPMLVAGLAIFWLCNFLIIFVVALGLSERFNDPSLTQFQMYWASTTSILSSALMPGYEHLVYFLVFVISIFGVFRLRPKAFIVFSFFQVSSIGVIGGMQQYSNTAVLGLPEQIMTWSVFSACILMLNILCRSITALRSRLRQQNTELQEALTVRGQFLANMSHELRTPMNGVIGMLQLIDKTALSKKHQRYLDIARSSGDSMIAMISDILDFSKMEAGKLELSQYKLDIKSSLYRLSESFCLLAREKKVRFIANIDPYIPDDVVADDVRICQLLNNLLSNALKFTSEGEIFFHIHIAQWEDRRCQFVGCIEDSGIGIEAESLEKIFESFSQADGSTTRQFGGTGLGLAITKKICELMGGSIRVSSEVGRGSVFEFTFWVEYLDARSKPPGTLNDQVYLILEDNPRRIALLENTIGYLNGRSVLYAAEQYDVNDVLCGFVDNQAQALLVGNEVMASLPDGFIDELHSLPAMSKNRIVLVGVDDYADAKNACVMLVEPLRARALYEVLSAANVPDESQHMPLEPHARGYYKGEPAKVLLVEDDEINREVATVMLKDCGLEVLCANDGLDALSQLKGHAADVAMIFMDCQMPRLDGYEATQAIRRGEVGEKLQSIPIIAVTANVLIGDRDKCLAAGMNDYVSKPVDFQEIQQKIDHWFPGDFEPAGSNGS